MSEPEPASCFNCDSSGGGWYRQHDGETKWFIGLDATGQAHYACEQCAPFLFDVHPLVTHNAVFSREFARSANSSAGTHS